MFRDTDWNANAGSSRRANRDLTFRRVNTSDPHVKLSELSLNPALAITLFWRWVSVTICVIASVVVAYWIGTQQTTKLTMCVAVVIIALVTAGFRDRAWVLIPLTWTLSGTSGFLPFGLSIHDVGILLASSAYIGYSVLAHRGTRRKAQLIDWLLALNVLWLLLAFIRHPAGLHAFGSETMGARPYINIVLALLAYRVILRLPDSVTTVSRVPYFILIASTITGLVNLIVYIAPPTTPYVYQFYSGIDPGRYLQSVANATEYTRFNSLAPFGTTLILVLCSFYPPRTLFNPMRWRFYFMLLAFAAIFASGFRNVMLIALTALAIGSWLHRGWRELALGVAVATILLGAILAGQGRLYRLPLQAQRTLCFLPGNWSPTVLESAEESSQTRFDWWRRIIEMRVIQNWWAGDGIGVAATDFNLFVSEGMTVQIYDWFTLTGAFHNGPLTTIRNVGIIGLIFFYVFMIAAAIYSVKCVERCRGSPLFPAAIFLALQLLWTPVHFTLVFGDYTGQLPEHIFLVGLLMLLWRMSERKAPSRAPATNAQPFVRNSGEALVST